MSGFLIISSSKKDFEIFFSSINLDTITPSGIKELLRTHENSPNSIRFEISGSESKVKAFDVSIFKDTNIDVKKKYEQKFANIFLLAISYAKSLKNITIEFQTIHKLLKYKSEYNIDGDIKFTKENRKMNYSLFVIMKI